MNPYVHQFSFGIQRALPWRTSIELTYVGSRYAPGAEPVGRLQQAPVELRNQCDPTMGGRPAFCNELLTNPFFQVPGFEGTARFTSPTLSRYELSRPFPHFGQITVLDRNDGQIWYNSAQLMVNKRVSDGLTLTGTYTLAKMIEENGGGNQVGGAGAQAVFTEADRVVQRSVYGSDRRHRITISGVYHLPFGRDRKYHGGCQCRPRRRRGRLGSCRHVAVQQRPPVGASSQRVLRERRHDWRHRLQRSERHSRRDPVRGADERLRRRDHAGLLRRAGVHGAELHHPAQLHAADDASIATTRSARPPFYQFDINFAKTFRFTSTMRLQVRWELYNVLDQVIYDERNYENNAANAAFGTIDRRAVRQSNFPRYGQLGLKLLF